ncbi:Trp biosynthesis-associated membrane protein [Microbacterium hominis]|uniref:Trp biosynthesis-associated membrane protein n=1 Tax=Microbacterium TaxID=33882 RepID=UPI00168AD0C0|nr:MULTISPECIES: Trp biosynthesis-associated membrane protein [Microbacterium]QOC25622.1 Trp biosynthesis-associated membrane protein [Microbacterium hominis]QOC29623.1 Trp biosynthesis-associated membrane protein [Microbacterium hominis]QYF98004.1 Trp biosynthesis-associated membrane protein [Microbacterium sp. PAMC21962]
MTARARSFAVLAIIAGGALAIISSTQTWLDVTLDAGATAALQVAGAKAFTMLAPLSLAALALGLALTVVGRALRYAFGALALLIGGTLTVAAARIAIEQPLDAVAAAVTTSTGLSGTAAIAGLVTSVTATPWPWLTVVAGVLIVAGGALTIATAHLWRRSGRRYRTDGGTGAGAAAPSATAASRPYDAIDSWDDLSHGDDPTAR